MSFVLYLPPFLFNFFLYLLAFCAGIERGKNLRVKPFIRNNNNNDTYKRARTYSMFTFTNVIFIANHKN